MITLLSGSIKELAPQSLTLIVGGIGFAVVVPDERLFYLNQDIVLQIYFHWNQETGPQLYGFTSTLARTVFMLIISCSGLGPKMGLAILAQITPEQFLQAIMLADVKALSSITGVGPKKAESMVMQLKDKVAKINPTEVKTSEGLILSRIKEVADALSSLNYSRTEIAMALDHVKKNCDLETSSFNELLRKALSFLAKNYKS
jgi:holliday junction DNA helicase RuvA